MRLRSNLGRRDQGKRALGDERANDYEALEVLGHMDYETWSEDAVGVETLHPEFVPVTFAGDQESAQRLRVVLEQHNIPALIDDLAAADDVFAAMRRGVPVLVPESMHERASDVLALQECGAKDLSCAGDDDDEEFEEDDDEFDEEFDDLDDLDDDYDDEDEDDDLDADVDDDDLD